MMHRTEIARRVVSCGREFWGPAVLAVVLLVGRARGQTCLAAEDMDAATRSGLEAAARQYFDLAAKGDVATLRQDSIPSLAANFGGIETAVKEHQEGFAGATATARPPFLLEAEGREPLERAEFLCGVFGKSGQTSNSSVFVIPNLPPGTYGVVILDVAATVPSTLSFILQKASNDWKVAGLYARAAQVAGHDGKWFWDRAQEFKAKGRNRDAWFYYLEARDLLAPVPVMSTMATDRIYDEMQSVQPKDLPVAGNTADLVVGSVTRKLTSAFPVGVENNVDLVVKYTATDISNTNQTFQDNVALIHALVGKFPELREGFAAVIARAVEPSGKDYGTLVEMKEIK